MTTREWWQARLIETKALGQRFDVTKTWTAEQRDADTRALWTAIRPHLIGTDRLVDFGCGLQRFRPFVLAERWRYVGVDILAELLDGLPDAKCCFHLFDGTNPIPAEKDGDSALFCLVLQHLDDVAARDAIAATQAKRRVIVDGIWATSAYSLARDPDALARLLTDCGAENTEAEIISTPLGRYKVVVGSW